MKRSLWLSTPVLGSLALLAVLTSSASARTSGTLQFRAEFRGKWHAVDCPPGTPETTGCYLSVGSSAVPGLGTASETYTLFWNQADPNCTHSTYTTAVIAVGGTGEIDASLTDPYTPCDPPPLEPTTLNFTIKGGSGKYAGALGSGTMRNVVHELGGGTGSMVDTWTGSLSASPDFDTTPPAISGANSKTVPAPKQTKRVRVAYKVTAVDGVDGPVPVTCFPRSASRFPIGRTKVLCSATDTSANTARVQFTITVKRTSR